MNVVDFDFDFDFDFEANSDVLKVADQANNERLKRMTSWQRTE
jgi:hypothetical protein